MKEARSLTDRWWDLPAAVLIMAAMLTAASRLAATRWTTHLSIAQTLVFFGAIAGLAVGKSRFSPRVSAFFLFVYGAFMIPWQLGITLDQGTPNLNAGWSERMLTLLTRLGVIANQLARKEAVQDSLLFLVLMFILFWVLSAHAGYSLTRYGNSWRAILPTGLALLVINSFDPLIVRRTWYLAVYIFFALVLVARMAFVLQHNHWQKSRTALPPHLGLDFIRTAILATALIVMFAWTAPALAKAVPSLQNAWSPVEHIWSATRDRFDNVFASLRSSAMPVSEFYGNSALLGRGNPLTDITMFTVKPPDNLPATARLYWRARTYETYQNGQWFNRSGMARAFDPQHDEIPIVSNLGRFAGSFQFTSSARMTTLFTPSQPIWVDRSGSVEYFSNPDGSLDVTSFNVSSVLDSGQVYNVQASVSNATVGELQKAGIGYPDWVTERYLQLPASITPRTRQLAETITAGMTTPYDKTVAITEYLRKNLTYAPTIDQDPPTNQDLVDWFIFDYKKGFCNYYSTAEIILLRSLGIPARWAIGYAQGESILRTGNAPQVESLSPVTGFVVRQRDAHSWPEVFFPGTGWVEFEPTASQPEIARLPGDNTDPAAAKSPSINDTEAQQRKEMQDELAALRKDRSLYIPSGTQQKTTSVVYWIVPLALLGVVSLLGWRFRNRINLQAAPIAIENTFYKFGLRPPASVQRWARHAKLPPLAKAYTEINHALSRLGKKPVGTETPAERASALGQIVPPASNPAFQLVNEYQLGIFSQQPANLDLARQAAGEVKRLSYKEYIHRMFAKLQRPPRPNRQTWQKGK